MDKRVTIYDIAERLGVSTATVNRAMNNKNGVSESTRVRVLDTAREMGFTVNQIAKSLARPPIKLGFIIYNHISVFHDEIIAGVQREADALKDYNVTCNIQSLTGDPFVAEKAYIDCLREVIASRELDGLLLLASSQTNELYSYVQQVCAAGIKVGLVGTDLPGSGRLFSCHQNAMQAGKIAAELLSRMTCAGKVAVFTGHKNVQDHYDSVHGFQDECKRRGMELIAVCENHDDPDFAAYNAENLFTKHPEIEGIYINTANSVSVCKKLKELGLAGKVRVVTSDVFQDLVDLIQEDIVQATIFQDPVHQGRKALKCLYRSISEGEVPTSDILIRPQIVLQSNLEEFLFFQEESEK